MRLDGRVLYLVDDAGAMLEQLHGCDLDHDATVDRLRPEVSTDEIIPARHCLHVGPVLGDFVYTGLRAGTGNPVGEGAVAAGGFGASVAGRRRGKGSSREHAPYAERAAGIRIVFAPSFERIYRQNCHNLGMVTSTRLDLLPRLLAGEDVPLEELCHDLDRVSLALVRAGGLFAYSLSVPETPAANGRSEARPSTLAERVLAGHGAGTTRMAAVGELQLFRTDLRYSHEYVTGMAEALVAEHAPGRDLVDADSILLFEDHLTGLHRTPGVDESAVASARRLAELQERFARDRGVRLHGRKAGWSEAICHLKVIESYALPGQLVVGSDSHTCHVGALGCVAVGVGSTDIASSWVTGHVLLPVPRQLLVRVEGTLRPGVTEKDLMLHLLRLPDMRAGAAIGALVEFAGPAIEALDLEARSTLTNMTAEMGATSGIVRPDDRTAAYLHERRGIDLEAARRLCTVEPSDVEAFDLVIEVDGDQVEPMVSLPGDPGNAVPLREVGGVRVQRAYGGSCTASKQRDMDDYARVLGRAVADGRRVHNGTELYIQVGSDSVLDYCREQGYLELFEAVGAEVLGPACGACINAGPGASTTPDDVAISAQNRNFPGRSGPGQLYLGSPLTVAQSALDGCISEFQPEE